MYTDEELIVAKGKCLSSLEFYTRFFFYDQYKRKFIIGDHHKQIFEALERVLRGECTRLIINLAPRYGKTEIGVKAFISHGLALNPSAKFIHLSYSDSLALDNSEAIKDLVQSELYQTLFPDVIIKKDSRSKDKWYTTEGGGVLARAAGGQVTGFGAGTVDDPEDFDQFLASADQEITPPSNPYENKLRFSGCVIIDDPIKPEDADGDTLRERVNSRFDSTIRNRVNSRNTPIIIIMQRLHPFDLAGYLLREGEADKWEVLCLPCIKDDGAALWPFKHTLEELLAMRQANEVVFERQYQQNPKPRAGLLFPIDDLKLYDPGAVDLDDPDFIYTCCDPAGSGGDDFAAITTKLIGNRIYVTDVLYNTEGADHNEAALVNMVLNCRCYSVGVESVFGWKEAALRVAAELYKKGFEGDFRQLHPRTSKHSRILNRSSFIRNNFYFRADYQDFPQYFKFMRNLTSYLRIQEAGKQNKRDDAPDVCEMAAAYYEKNFTHLY